MNHSLTSNINSETMRTLNVQGVLDYIRRHEPVSRRDIAEYGGLTVAAVSNITGQLLGNGFVVEVGAGESVGGRRPAMLGINAHCRYAMGIDLTTDRIKLMISNFKAEVIYKTSCDVELELGWRAVLDRLCSLIDESVAASGIEQDKLIGVGIVSAGPCDPERGLMQNPPNFPGWDNVNIRDYVQERTSYPVVFDKDAIGAVMAEHWFGSVSDCSQIFAMLINKAGVGGGIIANGQIFRGAGGGAGEIGHTVIDIHGARCSCGDYGCLESLVNAQALVHSVRGLLKVGRDSQLSGRADYDTVTLDDVLRAAEQGDPLCREELCRIADYLAVGVRNIATIYAPECIVLAGGLICECSYLLEAVLERVERWRNSKFVKSLNVVGCSFGKDQCAMGAIALVLQRFYTVIKLD